MEDILKFSAALDFDFLKDYNDWLHENNQPLISVVSEPLTDYKKREKMISVNLKIRGEHSRFGEPFGELIKTIKKEADKHGFDIE